MLKSDPWGMETHIFASNFGILIEVKIRPLGDGNYGVLFTINQTIDG
jgi:hypothetical protein